MLAKAIYLPFYFTDIEKKTIYTMLMKKKVLKIKVKSDTVIT